MYGNNQFFRVLRCVDLSAVLYANNQFFRVLRCVNLLAVLYGNNQSFRVLRCVNLSAVLYGNSQFLRLLRCVDLSLVVILCNNDKFFHMLRGVDCLYNSHQFFRVWNCLWMRICTTVISSSVCCVVWTCLWSLILCKRTFSSPIMGDSKVSDVTKASR